MMTTLSRHDAAARSGSLTTASRFRHDTRGTLAVWTGVLALPLALSVGVAMDIQRAGRDHGNLKATLDAAVLAAVNNNAISDRNRADFAEQAFRDAWSGSDIVALSADTTDDVVSMEAKVRMRTSLASVAGISELEISARSSAALNLDDVVCVLALDEEAEGAVTFADSLGFYAPTCSVQSNSRHADAIVSEGITAPVARNFCAHGGTRGEFAPGGTGECARISDPYARRKLPEPGMCQRIRRPGVHDLESRFAERIKEVVEPVVAGDDMGDLVRRVEAVVRAKLDDKFGTSEYLEPIVWHDENDPDKARLHIPFRAKTYNPFDESKKNLHIDRDEIKAFLTKYEAPPEEVELDNLAQIGEAQAVDDDSSYTVAVVELSDGRTVDVENDDSPILVDNDVTLSPGTYCNGLTIAGANVELTPGIYHMLNGPFVVKDTAQVVGEGVTVILAGSDAHLKVESDGRLELKAPKAGTTKGLVVAEDMKRPSLDEDGMAEGLTSRVASGGELVVVGTVHLPSHAIKVTGNGSDAGSRAPSTSFIANTFHFGGTGNVDISVDHRAAGLPPVQPRSEDGARLVE